MAPAIERGEAGDGPVIQGFSNGAFTVDGHAYRGLFLTPQSAFEWQAPAMADLTVEELAPLLALDPPPEFILLGTGPTQRFPARALVAALDARGVGVEAMDSRAAARTWGVLRAEHRWIAAALMPL